MSAQLIDVHDAGEAGDVRVGGVGVDDLLGVLRVQVVLRLASGELAVGVDEQHLTLPLGEARPSAAQHQDAGWDAGAVEQVRGQADDSLQPVVLDDALADMPSAPPRNSTPCGMTVAPMPSGFRTARMCWTNIRSAFLPVSGAQP